MRRDLDVPSATTEDAGEYGALISALQSAQDAVHDASLPVPAARLVTALLREAATLAAVHRVPAELRPVSRRAALPGRGNAILPAFVMRPASEHPPADVGSGRFTSAFEGRGAVHGGAIALLFDEILGRLVERDSRLTRTAYLRVNYRRLTPVGRDLAVRCRVDRTDGRKLWVSAELADREHLLADAERLWIRTRAE